MSYFVTGATGFIGRYLVSELLENREGEIYLLCRDGSRGRLDALIAQWGGSPRLVPVIGDLRADKLGVDEAWIAENKDRIKHFFHLAAIYDMTASEEMNEELADEVATDEPGGAGDEVGHGASSLEELRG
jgi:thioester reductase-like protein